MRLDDRPALDQLMDPDPVAYCGGCGDQLPHDGGGCAVLWGDDL